jgi:hypothetical protein
MICDVGFVALTRSPSALGFGVTGLTSSGHEFPDSVRDPEIWRKTIEGANKAGSFTVGHEIPFIHMTTSGHGEPLPRQLVE